jgi:hypothetical protein
MKQAISLIETKITIGFLYWLNETHDLRGLKNVTIDEYPHKIMELNKQYNMKYPEGLTGWNDDNE